MSKEVLIQSYVNSVNVLSYLLLLQTEEGATGWSSSGSSGLPSAARQPRYGGALESIASLDCDQGSLDTLIESEQPSSVLSKADASLASTSVRIGSNAAASLYALGSADLMSGERAEEGRTTREPSLESGEFSTLAGKADVRVMDISKTTVYITICFVSNPGQILGQILFGVKSMCTGLPSQAWKIRIKNVRRNSGRPDLARNGLDMVGAPEHKQS